jgi:nucleotide-binding universal stress UspA family protein
MVVKGKTMHENWQPHKILVPTNGTKASKDAAEVAFAFAKTKKSNYFISILNVIVKGEIENIREHVREVGHQKQMRIGYQIVKDLRTRGESLGVKVEGMIQTGSSPDAVILKIAEKNGFDLIVLGTDIRPGSDRLFLGPRVERILRMARCPVLIVNS